MRNFSRLILPVTLLLSLLAGCSKNEEKTPLLLPDTGEQKSSYGIEIVATHLNVPWEIAFADEGQIFFTERPGDIRLIRNGKLLKKPILSLSSPFISKGEGGLLGLALDPDYQENHYMYVYHTYQKKNEVLNRVLRILVENDQAKIDKILLDGVSGNSNHNGGRIKIGPDGLLYITAGEKYEPELAQNKDSMGGKIFRINLDGTIPKDNPDPDSPVYSYGHRNPQGLAWHPKTGKLYSSEHGQTAYDEINLIEKGKNYGWPVIEGDEIKEGMVTPIVHSGHDTWAPSGMAFVTKGKWKNQLLVANLRGKQLLRIKLNENGTKAEIIDALFKEEFGRIRNVAEAPDGSIYLLTNNRDGRGVPGESDDQLIRLIPTDNE